MKTWWELFSGKSRKNAKITDFGQNLSIGSDKKTKTKKTKTKFKVNFVFGYSI